MADDAAWPSLAVQSWTPTRDTLHMWTQIVGKIRMALAAPVNHWWHVTLRVDARGLTTGAIPIGSRLLEIAFDFLDHVLLVRTSDGGKVSIPLPGRSVAQLYAEVFDALRHLDVEVVIHPSPNEVEVAIPFADDTVHSTYVPEQATAFWRQLIQADRVLQRFRSEFRGKVSPVHFFWGAMDLAVTRFSGRTAPPHPGGAPNCPDSVMREGYSHELSSAGFWPGGGSEGAFYSYAYPAPDGYAEAELPPGASFSEEYGEFLLPYEAARASADPDATVLAFLRATYAAAAQRADWPPELLIPPHHVRSER
ncbi:hypothetical protein ASF88_16520 [Leifsonia sp. Leaf336]|uniref:DUF5996 family protein n=1 Tax=Leifsonia sp. Leaf336 TaxID=1736341 RepID=UPI0006FFF5F3|nr:DUF5996 family protein [Leifsonia sp. Leaf336]KQR50833.1 hypothetical protein ASF88_16520 [Leifsonia sp. Leaf336]